MTRSDTSTDFGVGNHDAALSSCVVRIRIRLSGRQRRSRNPRQSGTPPIGETAMEPDRASHALRGAGTTWRLVERGTEPQEQTPISEPRGPARLSLAASTYGTAKG